MLVSVDFTALIKWKIGDLVFDVGCDAPVCRPNSPVDRSVATFPGNISWQFLLCMSFTGGFSLQCTELCVHL